MTGDEKTERGRPASFDRRSGAVHGSGSGAGGDGTPGEDHDRDPQGGGGSGHPLPASEEARHDEIPEHLGAEKGRGGDTRERTRPAGDAVAPDGEPYSSDELAADQAAHQDRGQAIAEAETDER